MTKLTTERLDEIANIKITEFSDGTDTANGAYQSVGSSEIVLMARQLLAYEQAAKNPAEYKVVSRFGDISLRNQKCEAEMYRSMKGFSVTPLYAAPVLPKQPDVTLTNDGETYKIIKAAEKLVRCKGRYHSEQNYRALAALFGVTVPDLPPLPADEAPAQPVIPEGLLQAINRLLDNDGSRGCFDALEQHRAKTELERLLASTAQPVSEPYKSAANDIIAERQRQISEEGWTPEHDDKYNDFQLALAAAGYAQNVADYAGEYCQPHSSINWTDAPEPEAWPWSPVWWKPTNPRRDLVKAGALILAEIERMDRIAPAQESE